MICSRTIPPQRFNIIVANLPYIPSKNIENLDTSVKDFEPHLALDGGQNGMQLIEKLLEQTPQYLAKDGAVWLEVDDTHHEKVMGELADIYGFSATFYPDFNGVKRLCVLETKKPRL